MIQESGLTIRECTSQDIPAILSVALQSYQEHYTYLWEDGGKVYMKRNFSTLVIEHELAEANSYFYLLLLKDEPVGFLKVNDEKSLKPYHPNECLELERIYLVKEVSGKGIGKVAINFVVNMARERKRKIAWLKAMDSSMAVLFYQKMGFQIIDTFALDLPYIKSEWKGMLVMRNSVDNTSSVI